MQMKTSEGEIEREERGAVGETDGNSDRMMRYIMAK